MTSTLATPSPATGSDPLSAVFLALADPTRRSMIQALSKGERTLTELAVPFKISLPAMTKHLRMLERAGLVRRTQQAQRKPCALQPEPLTLASNWIEQHRAEWEARLDRLDAFVLALQAEPASSAISKTNPTTPTSPSTGELE
jgi:DNA-binding transcriptional ArsR family regulator